MKKINCRECIILNHKLHLSKLIKGLSYSQTIEQKIVKKRKKKNGKHMKFDVFNNANVLIRPEVDASDKEVLARNNFISETNKIKIMMTTDNFHDFHEFVPKKKGNLSSVQIPIIHSQQKLNSVSKKLIKTSQQEDLRSNSQTKIERKTKTKGTSSELLSLKESKQRINDNIQKGNQNTQNLRGKLKRVINYQKQISSFKKTKEDYEGIHT